MQQFVPSPISLNARLSTTSLPKTLLLSCVTVVFCTALESVFISWVGRIFPGNCDGTLIFHVWKG